MRCVAGVDARDGAHSPVRALTAEPTCRTLHHESILENPEKPFISAVHPNIRRMALRDSRLQKEEMNMPAVQPTRQSAQQHRSQSAATTTQNPTTSNQNLYNQLFSRIQAAYLGDFVGSDNQLLPQWQFQFPNPVAVQQAQWVNPLNNDFLAYQQFEVGDLAPASKQGQYTADTSQPSIWTNYGLWLGAVLPANLNSIPAYVNAQKEQLQDAQDMTNAINGAGPAFSTWSEQNPGSNITTVAQWLAQTPPLPAAEPFATNYQNASASYSSQLAEMSQIAKTADALLSQAQADYRNPDFQQTYATFTGVKVTEGIGIVGNTDGTLNPQADWAAWSTGQSNPPDLTPFTATITQGVVPVSTIEPITLTETVQFSFFFGLFSCSVTEQVTFFQEITQDENFSVDMNWASLVMYPITRQGWYSQQALESLANQPLSPGNNVDFFGPEAGTLFLIPSQIFLGWNPSLTLTLSTTLYNQWESQISSSEGVWLNGVELPGPPTSATNNPDGTTTVNYGDPESQTSMSQLPFIIGYLHFVPTTTGTD
jgi:hypothetical protein